MSALRVGSLFAGIGGFDLGLERAGGFETAWFCEQDEFCQHVLREHWPDVPCYPDICDLKGCDVESVDVLCGGFPCQDLSVAGKGAGLDGARSGLWGEYARLVGELRPRYVLVENVSALLARGMGRVLGDLAALGYDAEWDCIPASAVGAPHRRDRVWLVAYPNGEGEPSEPVDARPGRGLVVPIERPRNVGNAGEGLEGHGGYDERAGERAARASGASVADTNGAGPAYVGEGAARAGIAGRGAVVDTSAGGCGEPGWSAEGWWSAEPDVGRVAHGVPARVDRLRSLGNALVPQIAEWIGRRVMDYEAAS